MHADPSELGRAKAADLGVCGLMKKRLGHRCGAAVRDCHAWPQHEYVWDASGTRTCGRVLYYADLRRQFAALAAAVGESAVFPEKGVTHHANKRLAPASALNATLSATPGGSPRRLLRRRVRAAKTRLRRARRTDGARATGASRRLWARRARDRGGRPSTRPAARATVGSSSRRRELIACAFRVDACVFNFARDAETLFERCAALDETLGAWERVCGDLPRDDGVSDAYHELTRRAPGRGSRAAAPPLPRAAVPPPPLPPPRVPTSGTEPGFRPSRRAGKWTSVNAIKGGGT